MNVLWIVNIMFPEAQALMTGKGFLKASGGWMLGLSNQLANNDSINLSVATVSNASDKLLRLEGRKITYYILPLKKYNDFWNEVISLSKPDIVHIHGSEFPWGLGYVNTCGSDNVVVSVQGLISDYVNYYHSGISLSSIFQSITVASVALGGILSGQEKFKKRAQIELDLLRKVKYIIGRTSWDRAHVWAINNKAHYLFCNEILRDEFYNDSRWSYDKCSKHVIFISQASYPIKGLHQVLKAMPLVLNEFPDTLIRIAGDNILNRNTFKQKLLFSSYSKYLKGIIDTKKINNHIEFTGPLDAEEMKREYLNANVFISPSSIENSPNSLGEAQILGVPCIASYVGGVPDMIPNNKCGTLYRFDDTDMLAKAICEVFNKSSFNEQDVMIEEAKKRHKRDTIVQNLIDNYNIVRANNRISQ